MAWTARGAEDVTICCISTTVVPWTDHLGGGKRGGRAVVGAHDGCYMCCRAVRRGRTMLGVETVAPCTSMRWNYTRT